MACANTNPVNFKLHIDMFEPVITRNEILEEWLPNVYAGRTEDGRYSVVGGAVFNHCLPYNGNEHLLNTNNGPDMCTVHPFRKYQIVAVRNGSKDNWHLRLYNYWSSNFYFVCINPDKPVMDNLENWRECESAQNVWRQCSL